MSKFHSFNSLIIFNRWSMCLLRYYRMFLMPLVSCRRPSGLCRQAWRRSSSTASARPSLTTRSSLQTRWSSSQTFCPTLTMSWTGFWSGPTRSSSPRWPTSGRSRSEPSRRRRRSLTKSPQGNLIDVRVSVVAMWLFVCSVTRRWNRKWPYFIQNLPNNVV